ncbi:glycosyltransferase family 4 protein [Arenibaculum pallidiluteum]|uniref:glycosyltransferase family 4 protein n=1 Tax=Arenibaculum pallidiluteum TaxID=2812559 RepID=UPI001A956C0B|nr:glycosyltransferase family 1 protein [Arenibaculum pallidiluteum]
MSLQGARVLVDAFNIQLPQGTGIKTYGQTLIETLDALGAEPSLLYSRPTGKYEDDYLTELAFFDAQVHPSRWGARLRAITLGIRGLLGTAAKARHVPISDMVLTRAIPPGVSEILNARHCYSLAFRAFRSFGRGVSVGVPKPFDVWHMTYPMPLRIPGARMVATIHDLVPMRLPTTTLDDKVEIFRRHRWVVENADLILTVSEASKRDIVKYLRVNPDRVEVTYQPARLRPATVSPDVLAARLAPYRIEPGRYLLFVGAIEPKKNVRGLIDAYMQIDTDMPLVIAGKKAWMWKSQIGDLHLAYGEAACRHRLRFVDYMPELDLPLLYKGAYCFAFPSLYEGFGLPVLEAMVSGIPVVTSNVSSLPEVAGSAGLQADPYDVADIRAKLEAVIGSRQLHADLSRRSLEQAKLFSRERYAERLAAAYAKVLG